MKKMCLFILVSVFIFCCGQERDSKEILFVCTHGAARSPIAAAYFNKLAKEKNINYHAVFRGTQPDKKLTAGTIDGLNKDNFNVLNWKPTQVSKEDVNSATKIVTFDCTLPSIKSSKKDVIEWNGTPSISKDYGVARNAIKEKVIDLVETLE